MKIRKLEIKDAKYMLEWMHDKDVVQDLRADFNSKTIDDCRKFIDVSSEDVDNLHLAITNDEDEYMGTVSLKNINSDSAEFGITIRRVAMGKGYSIFAMKEIFQIGFYELGLNMIYWCVSPSNIRACRFYDKNGFSRCNIPDNVSSYTDEQKKQYYWYCVRGKCNE